MNVAIYILLLLCHFFFDCMVRIYVEMFHRLRRVWDWIFEHVIRCCLGKAICTIKLFDVISFDALYVAASIKWFAVHHILILPPGHMLRDFPSFLRRPKTFKGFYLLLPKNSSAFLPSVWFTVLLPSSMDYMSMPSMSHRSLRDAVKHFVGSPWKVPSASCGKNDRRGFISNASDTGMMNPCKIHKNASLPSKSDIFTVNTIPRTIYSMRFLKRKILVGKTCMHFNFLYNFNQDIKTWRKSRISSTDFLNSPPRDLLINKSSSRLNPPPQVRKPLC
jgi:hypothetical protein